jgi:hypothetical protein
MSLTRLSTKTSAPAPSSFNGTMAQVAAFFCVDYQTVAAWKSNRDPKTGEPKDIELGHFQQGRTVVIGEDDVVRLWVRRHVNADGEAPGELEAKARRAWREHLGIVTAEARLRQEMDKIKGRLEAVESRMAIQHREAA